MDAEVSYEMVRLEARLLDKRIQQLEKRIEQQGERLDRLEAERIKMSYPVDLSGLTSGEAVERLHIEGLQKEDPVGCGCDEFPECTHSLYWYMGYKAAKTEQ